MATKHPVGQRRAGHFDPGERRLILEALQGYVVSIDSFLSDADGDDVDNVRDDRKTTVALIAEFTE